MRLIIKQSVWNGHKDQPVHEMISPGISGVPRKGDYVKVKSWKMCEVNR